MAELKMDQF